MGKCGGGLVAAVSSRDGFGDRLRDSYLVTNLGFVVDFRKSLIFHGPVAVFPYSRAAIRIQIARVGDGRASS